MHTREQKDIFLFDFDGTLTNQDGQKTITSDLYEKLTVPGSGRFNDDSFQLKSIDDMVTILRQEFAEQKTRDNQRITKGAIEYLKELTNPGHAPVGIAIITRNFESYLKAMLTYEFEQEGLKGDDIQKRLETITIMDRKSCKPYTKEIAARQFLTHYDEKEIRKIHVVDDHEPDGLAMERAAQEKHVPVMFDYKDNKKSDFTWEKFKEKVQKSPVQKPTSTHAEVVNVLNTPKQSNQSTLAPEETALKEYMTEAFSNMQHFPPNLLNNLIMFLTTNLDQRTPIKHYLDNHIGISKLSPEAIKELQQRLVYLEMDNRHNMNSLQDKIQRVDKMHSSSAIYGDALPTLSKVKNLQEHIANVMLAEKNRVQAEKNSVQAEKRLVAELVLAIESESKIKLGKETTKHPEKQQAKEELQEYISTVKKMLKSEKLTTNDVKEIKNKIHDQLANLAIVSQREQSYGNSDTAKAINKILEKFNLSTVDLKHAKRSSREEGTGNRSIAHGNTASSATTKADQSTPGFRLGKR